MLSRIALTVLLAFPLSSLAHTRWFSPATLPSYVPHEPTSLYLALWGIIAAIIVCIGFYFERRGWLSLSFLHPKRSHSFQ
ncbi:MAG: hypothetical protein RI911_748, partial [Candidatus Parcubacteria bacterium]